MDFVALDFETANADKSSVCSVGVVSVENDKIVDEFYSLVKPEPLQFDADNIAVHGLTAGMVSTAPTFAELWPELFPRLDGKIIVAHYAKFDLNVLKAVLDQYQLSYPAAEYTCSWEISKAAWPDLPTYRLDVLADKIGFRFQHHNAIEDARACAELLLSAAKEVGEDSLPELVKKLDLKMGILIEQTSLFG